MSLLGYEFRKYSFANSQQPTANSQTINEKRCKSGNLSYTPKILIRFVLNYSLVSFLF